MRPMIALMCCFLVASVASAKDLKLAVVDMQKLFDGYPGTQKAKDKLKDIEKKKMNDLTDTAQELKDLQKELNDSSSVLSEKQKARKEREFNEKKAAFDQDQAQAQKELMGKENEMTQNIVGEIKAIVATIAKGKDFDLVLDQDKTVYARDAVDLTDDVLKSFKNMDKEDNSKK